MSLGLMIACIDVGYTDSETRPTVAIAACVLINNWRDSAPVSEHVIRIRGVLDYQPTKVISVIVLFRIFRFFRGCPSHAPFA